LGEGTIIVRDASTGLSTGGTSIGSPDTYDGLNRDVTLAQYNTKEGGLSGGFTVDDNLVQLIRHPIETPVDSVLQIYQGLIDAKDTTVLIYNEAGEVIENTGNWIEFDHYVSDDKLKYYQTMDEYEALKASGGEVTPLDTLIYYKSKVAAGEELTQEEIDEYAKVSVIVRDEALKNSIRAKDTILTTGILEKTGWDGEPITNIKNKNVINQMSSSELKAAGLPDQYGACMFFSTIYSAADALGVTLTPEEVKEIYNEAKKNGAVSKTSDEGKYMPYWVNDFSDCVTAVAEIKKVDASNISIGAELIKTTPSSNKEVASEIIGALDSGGSAQVRYSGHSMRVDGSFIENGVVILSIKDTAAPNTKTYIDTSTMTLYTIDDDGIKSPSNRVITHYLPIKKNNNVVVNQNEEEK